MWCPLRVTIEFNLRKIAEEEHLSHLLSNAVTLQEVQVAVKWSQKLLSITCPVSQHILLLLSHVHKVWLFSSLCEHGRGHRKNKVFYMAGPTWSRVCSTSVVPHLWHSVEILESQLCPSIPDVFCVPTYKLAVLLETCGRRAFGRSSYRDRGRKDENEEIIFVRNKPDVTVFLGLFSWWRKVIH